MAIIIILASVLSMGLCQILGGLTEQPISSHPVYLEKALALRPELGASPELKVLKVETQVLIVIILNELQREEVYLVIHTPCEDSDQPAHAQADLSIHWIAKIQRNSRWTS